MCLCACAIVFNIKGGVKLANNYVGIVARVVFTSADCPFNSECIAAHEHDCGSSSKFFPSGPGCRAMDTETST